MPLTALRSDHSGGYKSRRLSANLVSHCGEEPLRLQHELSSSLPSRPGTEVSIQGAHRRAVSRSLLQALMARLDWRISPGIRVPCARSPGHEDEACLPNGRLCGPWRGKLDRCHIRFTWRTHADPPVEYNGGSPVLLPPPQLVPGSCAVAILFPLRCCCRA